MARTAADAGKGRGMIFCETCKDYAMANPYAPAVLALTGHYPNCPLFSADIFTIRAVDLIEELAKGIEAWAEDEDGVHPEVWDAYQEAKAVISGLAMPGKGEE